MPNTNLIIAIVFAAIFGTALIWLILYYSYRYIHQRCLELDHWFHLITSRQHEPQACCYEKTQGRSSHSKSRSRSRTERRRGRSQYEKYRKRYGNRDWDRLRGNLEWPGQKDVRRARQMLPTSEPVQNQWQEQQFYPSFGWPRQAPGGAQMAYPPPMSYPQMPGQGAAHMSPFVMPATVPQQAFSPKATATPKPAHYQRQYQQPYTETCSDTFKDGEPEKPPMRPKPPRRFKPNVHEVDYIHICDEYPPIVLEALKKTEERPPSSSSGSSDASGTTQEVPRASIPRATPQFTDNSPFQFPQYPHLATQAWNAPTSYPRQWMDNRTGGERATKPTNMRPRYAPSMKMGGQADANAHQRRQAPISEASRSRTYERQRQQPRSPRRGRKVQGQPPKPRDEIEPSQAEPTENKRTRKGKEQEAEIHPGGRPDDGKNVRSPVKKGAAEGSPASQQIPLFEPMPVPIIEEPLTPTSEGRRSKSGSAPTSAPQAGDPRTPPVPVSPLMGMPTPLMSPWSSVSSVHEGKTV